MYWGAADEPRGGAEDPGRRRRRLGTAIAVTMLSIGGTVAMASASPSHANANQAAVATAARVPVTAPTAPSTTSAPSTTAPTTVAPTTVAPTTVPPTTVAPVTVPVTQPPPPPTTATTRPAAHVTAAAPTAGGAYTCGAALAYLAAHSAPGFQFECPGYALGHQAMTCIDEPGACPGIKLIAIAVVCPASYMNEAHNSWILSGLATGTIDPYGYCH